MAPARTTLVWFRRDLRLQDNRVLTAALARGGPVIPFFLLEERMDRGTAGEWWLGRSLESLNRDLLAKRSRLIIRQGETAAVLRSLISETGATAVLWDESFEPAQRKIDEKVRVALRGAGIFCDAVSDSLLYDPRRIRNKQGTPFKVFTPFWNHCLSLEEPASPVRLSGDLPAPSSWPSSDKIGVWSPGPRKEWTQKIAGSWTPGEKSAGSHLEKFLSGPLLDYPLGRDHPATEGTSKLSPFLHFGEISPRQVWHETRRRMAECRRPGALRAAEAFLRQLVWREFARHMLFHFPEMVSMPLHKEFLKFSWRKEGHLLRAWRKGETGYPLVDAGMRQLWATGWMHNRVRMIAASLLVKDMLQPWQEGAAWFMETLVDADLANNAFGWQWVAGCGADAAPYFRIFNPVLQGIRFDPRGAYTRRWVPELSKLPDRYIHRPWEASPGILAAAGVRLDKNYPSPVVDHDAGRKRALLAYSRMKK